MTTPRDPDADGDALIEHYRRASATAPLAPTDAVRAAILAEAARVAADQSAAPSLTQFDASVPAANEWRWKLTAFGTVAAAVLAAILVAPHYREARQPPEVARVTAPVLTSEQGVAGPAAAAPIAAAAPSAKAAPDSQAAKARPSGPARQQAPLSRAPSDSLAPGAIAGALPPQRRDGEAHVTAPQSPARADVAQRGAFNAGPAAAPELGNVTASAAAPREAAVYASARARVADPGAALRAASVAGDTQTIAALLASGAALEDRDTNGRTALMVAAASGRIDAVRLLLARGAATQAVDRDGQDALGLARHGGFEEIAGELERAARH